MTSLVEFLFPAPAPRSVGSIYTWWERRRLPYNLIVGSSGVVSLATALTLAWLPPNGVRPDFVPWQPIVVFAVLANLFYFLGPVVEIAAHKVWGRQLLPVGPVLYRMGLTFSVGLTFLPTMLMILFFVARIVGLAP